MWIRRCSYRKKNDRVDIAARENVYIAYLHVALEGKVFAAKVAREGLHAFVVSHVRFQIALLGESVEKL